MAETEEIERALVALLREQPSLGGRQLEHAGPFTDAQNAPGNRGVVLRLADGSEFHLSIIRVHAP